MFQNDDIEVVKEYIEVLSDPNSCLENANRLNFALSVVGDFEEAENTKQEIDDLKERWEKALEYLEQQVKEGYVIGSSKENVCSIQNDCVEKESETDSKQNLVQQEDKHVYALESSRAQNTTPFSMKTKMVMIYHLKEQVIQILLKKHLKIEKNKKWTR